MELHYSRGSSVSSYGMLIVKKHWLGSVRQGFIQNVTSRHGARVLQFHQQILRKSLIV